MTLPKKFGFWVGLYVVAANMIGSGILTVSGPILRDSANVIVLLALWIVGGVVALCGSLSLAEIASNVPKTGGSYAIVRHFFGDAWGFTFGLAMIVVGFSASLAVLAYTTANYFYPSVEHILPVYLKSPPFFSAAVGSLIILAVSVFHCLNHRVSGLFQGATTWFKVGTLLALATGLMVYAPATLEHKLALFAEFPKAQNLSFSILSVALIQVFFAYSGWDASAYLAGETKDAAKIIPKSITYGTLFVTCVYMFINISYAFSVPSEELRTMPEILVGRIAEVASTKVFGAHVTKFITMAITLGIIASISSYILTGSRVCYAMAEDKLLPQWMKKTPKNREVPTYAVLFVSALSIGFLWSGTFEQILNFTGFGLTVLSNLMILGIFILRKNKVQSPYMAPFFPWLPIIFLLINNISLVGSLMENPRLCLLSLALVLSGYPIFLIRKSTMQ